MADPTILIAFTAGLGSFIAPCILPMIPAFLAYISGTTLNEIKHNQKSNFQINRVSIIANTIFFVLGFSVVFSTLGVLINSILSSSVTQFLGDLNSIAGIIVIIFGVFLLLSQKINFINKEKKIQIKLSNVFRIWFSICDWMDTMCWSNIGNDSNISCNNTISFIQFIISIFSRFRNSIYFNGNIFFKINKNNFFHDKTSKIL